MSTLIIIRGLPGCGKTTAARKMKFTLRVNRDDLRAMLLETWNYEERELEDLVTRMQFSCIQTALLSGFDTVCDDTNLSEDAVVMLQAIATLCKGQHRIVDMRDVRLDVCLKRNAQREVGKGYVDPNVIVRMYHEYIEGKQF